MVIHQKALLIQPPMVEEGADVVYPSLPILGAALAEVGHDAAYWNLNLDYIVYEKRACLSASRLLSPERLFAPAGCLSVENMRFSFWAACFASLASELGDRLKVTTNGHVCIDNCADCNSFFSHIWKDYAAYAAPQLLIDYKAKKIQKIKGDERFVSYLDINHNSIFDDSISFVAITVPMVDNIGYALALSRWIRVHSPKVPLLLGGTAFSAVDPWLLQCIRNLSFVDLIVEGPGENAVVAMALNEAVPTVFHRRTFTSTSNGKTQLLKSSSKSQGCNKRNTLCDLSSSK